MARACVPLQGVGVPGFRYRLASNLSSIIVEFAIFRHDFTIVHQVICIRAFNSRQSSNIHSRDEVSKLFSTFFQAAVSVFKAAVSILNPILLASWRGSCKVTPLITPSCVANKFYFIFYSLLFSLIRCEWCARARCEASQRHGPRRQTGRDGAVRCYVMVIPKAALVRNNLQHDLAPLLNSASGLQRFPNGMSKHKTVDVPCSQIIWSL